MMFIAKAHAVGFDPEYAVVAVFGPACACGIRLAGGGYARLPATICRRTMLAMQYGISVL